MRKNSASAPVTFVILSFACFFAITATAQNLEHADNGAETGVDNSDQGRETDTADNGDPSVAESNDSEEEKKEPSEKPETMADEGTPDFQSEGHNTSEGPLTHNFFSEAAGSFEKFEPWTYLALLAIFGVLGVLFFLSTRRTKRKLESVQSIISKNTYDIKKTQSGQTEVQQELERIKTHIDTLALDWQNNQEHTDTQAKTDIQQELERVKTCTDALVLDWQNNQEHTKAQIETLTSDLETLKSNGATEIKKECQVLASEIVQNAQAEAQKLAQAYNNGEPIDLHYIQNPTQSQRVLVILNFIASEINEWKNELQGSPQPDTNSNLIQTLVHIEEELKDKLKEIRGAAPNPSPLEIQAECSTVDTLNQIRSKCDVYVAQFRGRLIGYEEGREVDVATYNKFIPQFVKDRLFNSIARCIPFEQLGEQLNGFLQLVGYEITPIEIGKTKADARSHDIQASRTDNVEPGTVVEVILPGLRRIQNHDEIVQKPVVIRGE